MNRSPPPLPPVVVVLTVQWDLHSQPMASWSSLLSLSSSLLIFHGVHTLSKFISKGSCVATI